MAYGSDFRVKVLMRDIQIEVTKALQKEGIENPLKLRIFDESNDDQKMWHEGGLTFYNENGDKLGSNDAAWYLEQSWTDPVSKNKSDAKPVLVVEGSYGTETGNVGSAQKARFNHAVGMAIREILGAYVMPKISEYYHVPKRGIPSPPICVGKSHWMKDIVLACLAISNAQKEGKYLMMDAYNKNQLFDLVYALAKNDSLGKVRVLDSIICEMKQFVIDYDVGKRFESMGNQTVPRFSFNNGASTKDFIGKILTHDIRAFTLPSKRNGHIIWGESEVLHYQTGKNVLLILPRFNKNDCTTLDGSKELLGKKEWTAMRKSDHIRIVPLEDLVFEPEYKHLISKFTDLRVNEMNNSDDRKSMRVHIKELKKGLLDGKIKIKN